MAESGDLAFAVLETQVREAEAAYGRGDYAAALETYRAALAARLGAQDASIGHLLAADLVVVERLAELSVLFGMFDAADDLLHAMVALTRSAGNHLGADYAQLKRVELTLARGAVRETFDLLRELTPRIGDITNIDMSTFGFARWEEQTVWHDLPAADRGVLFSRVYYLFARLLAALGQYHHAVCAAERSQVHTHGQAADLAQQARIPIALVHASALFEAGELDGADGALRGIRGAIADATQPGLRVAWLELRGRGHIEEAEHGAHALKDQGALARARFLRHVADARRRSLAEAVSLELSVTEMLRRPQRTDAPTDNTSALTDVPQSPNFLTLFEDRALQVQWLIAQGELDGAQSLLAELGQDGVFGATPSRLIRTRLDVLRGLLAYYRGEPQLAFNLLAPAADRLAAMRLRPELWQVLRMQGWCAARLGRKADEQALVERAEQLMEEIARSLDGAERAIFLLNKWTTEEEYLATEITRLAGEKSAFLRSGFLKRPFAWLRMARRLNRLMARVDRHKALIAETAVGSSVAARRPPSLLRRLLSGQRRRIVVSFLVLPDRILVVRAGLWSLDFHVSATSRIELREQVRRWHERANRGGATRDLGAMPPPDLAAGTPTELAIPLAEALQLPQLLVSLPVRTTTLTIVPDDALHGFPFAAMRVGDRQLIDRFAISTAFESAPVRRSKRPQRPAALLVAVSRGSGRIPPLPQTIAEVDRVRAWLAERGVASRTLVDDRASKSGVMEALQDAAVVHVACHGVFVPDRPDASGMLLVPDAERTEILSLRDLSQLRLSGCEHVTLSSCWSADNFILPGRWIVSLPETLYRSGARSVLACTWPVDDRVAERFMERFYAQLGTLPRAEALRRTQIECRAGALPGCSDIDTSDPFYWAGFNLFGEAGRLGL